MQNAFTRLQICVWQSLKVRMLHNLIFVLICNDKVKPTLSWMVRVDQCHSTKKSIPMNFLLSESLYFFLFTSFVIFKWFISSAMEMLKIERRTKFSCMTSAAWNVRGCPLLSKKADCAVFEESGNEDTWSQFLVIYFGSPDLPVLWSFIASDFPH